MKENKHNVIFFTMVLSSEHEGMWHYFFFPLFTAVIMMFRITRLSSERTVLDIDCFMHYTKHIQ